MSGDQSFCGEASSSPWQRMKWTDAMVKLLINVVMLVGDPANLAEVANSADPSKHKPAQGGGGALLLLQQKKGKWKAVSRAMMTHGCFVAPQQCEDKFNDLNKRYKKLNDILGKGVSCAVVEDPTLLDHAIAHLPPKAKDDVKKILASKHLFYKEMCAYYNGCKTASHPHAPPDLLPHQEPPTDNNNNNTDTDDRIDGHGEEEKPPFGKRRKMSRPLNNDGNLSLQFATQSGNTKSGEEASPEQWLEVLRILKLEEQQIRVQFEALELEKERFKWKRIAFKRERELERERVDNERAKLENDRMALQLKQQELGIERKRSEMSMASIALILHRLQEQTPKESDVEVVTKQEGHSFGQGVER